MNGSFLEQGQEGDKEVREEKDDPDSFKGGKINEGKEDRMVEELHESIKGAAVGEITVEVQLVNHEKRKVNCVELGSSGLNVYVEAMAESRIGKGSSR